MQSVPIRVIARVRPERDSSSCLEIKGSTLTVTPFVVGADADERRTSPRRSSVSNARKSSIGCSSLIPRTPHTPRGLLRGVVSVFPVMEEAAAQPESFVASAVLGPEATQDTLFELLVQDVKSVLSGYRASVLCYGVAESGKSFSLWGTESDRGLVPRALELMFATAPPGSRVTLSLAGLDDTSAADYLSPSEEAPIQSPQFKDGLDGGKSMVRCTSVTAPDAASAWDVVLGGLSRSVSDRHTVLTINVFIPQGDDSSLVGTLQVAEISLPGADERVSRNVSTLHDIVRALSDKSFRGAVDYSGSLLTSLIQPAFGGNSRTSVILNVHQSIQQYHHTIQTMSFGELCSKLKNVATPVVLAGVTPVVSVDAPAEMVGQIKELRSYAEELELENDDLRRRLTVWEERVADGKHRFELQLRREQEESQARLIEANAQIASLSLQLQQQALANDAQELMLARLRVQMVRNKAADLAEVEKSAALHAESLMATIAELKSRSAAPAPAAPPAENGRPAAELREQLLTLQKETEELRAALLEQQQQQQQQAQSVQKPMLNSAVLREKDAEIRAMNEEMRIKEMEMAEREREIEELNDKVDFLTAQVHTINFLKASVNSLSSSVRSSQPMISSAPAASASAGAAAVVTKKSKTVAPSDSAVAAAKAKAKEKAAQKKREKEEREEAERQAQLAREEDERIEEEMRREQIRQEKQARQRAKREREEQKKRQQKEAEEEKARQIADAVPELPPRPVPLSQKKKKQKQQQKKVQEPEPEPVQEDEQEIEDDAAPEEVPEIEDPVPTPLPARGGKKRAAPTSAKKGSTKAAPAQTAPISPVPGLVPIAVSRVPSPNENVEVQQEPAQKKGRKKLYNGAEKKSRKPEFRKSLAPTPASAGPVTRTNAAALGRLGGGADDYRSMLGDLLENNLYSVKTPSK